MTQAASPFPTADFDALLKEVAEIIVAALNLETTAAEIEPDAPLFGDGLGLDSIDILEVALVVSKRYGFQLKADNEDNVKIFTSLRTLAAHIAAQRTK
ncbi:MAG TPA: phosphopantetheine-binding protein [Azospira sp.]|nr:phosphopantetheine-binding protein [Azospira sp.]